MPAQPIMPQAHPFVKTLAQALRHRCRVPEGAPLLVAVSGGADSVALLHALSLLAPRRHWNLHLTVAHVQHHLRPDEQAEADARFVQRLAQRLHLPFMRQDLNPTDWPKSDNLESAARSERYAALVQMALAGDCRFIVTAHHADDQLETLLMRLLRGTWVTGLRGIAWRSKLPISYSPVSTAAIDLRLIRPMLAVDHAQAKQFLRHLRRSWREDHTNRDLSRWRSCLRARVLPWLHRLRPDAGAQAVRLAGQFSQLTKLTEQATQEAMDQVSWNHQQWSLPRKLARAWPRLILAGVLRRLLLDAGTPKDRLGGRMLSPMIRAIRDHHGGQRRFQINKKLVVLVDRNQVTIRPIEASDDQS